MNKTKTNTLYNLLLVISKGCPCKDISGGNIKCNTTDDFCKPSEMCIENNSYRLDYDIQFIKTYKEYQIQHRLDKLNKLKLKSDEQAVSKKS